jgi:hypothetical protein
VKKVLPASTRRALGRRAIQTASLPEHWATQLQEEANKQNIELWKKTQWHLDHNLPITFKRGDIRNLIREMLLQAQEIRRFSN